MKKLTFTLICLLAALTCQGRTITVDDDGPADFNNIQAAIDDSNDGDVVIVADGTYTGHGNENIDFAGKAIIVRSQNGPEHCAIRGPYPSPGNYHRGFYFHTNEGPDSVVEGFTITNCWSWSGGSGINCEGSSPTIRNCKIIGNKTANMGGGIRCSGSNPTISNCFISENRAHSGGGIHCRYSSPTIRNCTITEHKYMYNGWRMNKGGAIYSKLTSNPQIDNCILWGNRASYGNQIYGSAVVTYSDIEGGWSGAGNIKSTPLLEADGYHLEVGSPCINAGDPAFVPAPGETDIDGEPRVMGGRADMGADEFTAAWIPTFGISPTEFEFSSYQGGPNPEPQILSICNAGGGLVNWEIMENCPWLDVYPSSGESSGEIDEVTLSVDVTGLTWGEYSCELTISDPGAFNSPQTVKINLTIYGPLIELSANEFGFQALTGELNPDSQILTIGNSAMGILNWTIAYDCDWLEVYPESGSSTGEIEEVTLSVDISGLAEGIYNCPLTISDPNAENSPQKVEVNLVVHTPVELYVPNPYPTIQAAIDDSNDGDVVIVAPGTYTGEGNRDIDFLGKTITVRSESGPENCIIDCNGTETDPHGGFLFHSLEDSESVLDGFTITNGHLAGFPGPDSGGGIYCYNSSPTIRNCIITGNSADWDGGGIYCYRSDPTIINCTITGNSAKYNGGGISCWYSNPTITNCIISDNTTYSQTVTLQSYGGGIYLDESNATITNCTISNNRASYGGGGIYCRYSSPTISNCTINDNRTDFYDGGAGAGGIYCSRGSPTISNCTISGNKTNYRGGGICFVFSTPTITNCMFIGNLAVEVEASGGMIWNSGSSLMITNCTFAENYAANGNAIACDSSEQQHPSNLQLTNCILWDGGNEIYNNDGSTIDITYSDIQNGWPGTGNIDVDPCFVSPGCWADANDPNIIVEPNDPNAIWIEGDYHLYPFSLCINAGDPNYLPEPNETDLDGSPRIVAGRIDMGAYESNHIEARLYILPRTINRHSRQRRIMTWLRLPEGIAKDDIDSNTPLLLYPGQIEPTRQYIFQRGRRIKRTSIIAYFDKSDLMDVISNNGSVELKLVGQLKTGRYFYGTDTVRIINRRPPPRRPWHSR